MSCCVGSLLFAWELGYSGRWLLHCRSRISSGARLTPGTPNSGVKRCNSYIVPHHQSQRCALPDQNQARTTHTRFRPVARAWFFRSAFHGPRVALPLFQLPPTYPQGLLRNEESISFSDEDDDAGSSSSAEELPALPASAEQVPQMHLCSSSPLTPAISLYRTVEPCCHRCKPTSRMRLRN